MKLFLLTTALATAIQANRLLQQLPVDSGCDNPPAGFSCLDNQNCCDIGDGVARCCNVTATTAAPAPSCGGIENCYQYDPDGCNTCTCDKTGLASCTEVGCTDTVDPNECIVCNDGYIPNDAGECETCSFIFSFDPVCCEGVTYSNSGAAGCNQVSCPPGSEITSGACSTPAPTCGGLENCYQYTPDGCNTCTCGSNGLAACTRIGCADTVDPNECLVCDDGYVPNDAGECETCYYTFQVDPVCCEGVTYSNSGEAYCNQVSCPPGSEITAGICATPAPTCGGIENCVSYTPDGCNTCNCGGGAFDFCTLIACEDTVDGNACRLCEDGYLPNDDGDCELCAFTLQFDPVCCDGVTYSNQGEAECNAVSCTGEITEGACTKATPAPTSEICECEDDSECGDGFECLETPFGFGGCDVNVGNSCYGVCTSIGSSCGDEDPNGGTCGDGETCYTGFTAEGEATNVGNCYSFPEDCDVVKTCDKNSDCSDGFKCRRDPICRVTTGLGCGSVDKVCVDIDGVCEEDEDCDGDTSCLIGNRNRGLCVNYE